MAGLNTDRPPEQAAERLRAFVDGYGGDAALRQELPIMLGRRTTAMFDLLREGAERQRQPWARIWTEDGPYWTEDGPYWRPPPTTSTHTRIYGGQRSADPVGRFLGRMRACDTTLSVICGRRCRINSYPLTEHVSASTNRPCEDGTKQVVRSRGDRSAALPEQLLPSGDMRARVAGSRDAIVGLDRDVPPVRR
jgi:hypothetical protein